MKNLAILISGSGSNLQAIIDAVNSGEIHSAKISVVISSNAEAYGLTRAAVYNIPTVVASIKDFENNVLRDDFIVKTLKLYEIDLVVLAGYLGIVGDEIVNEYMGRIINIHPSLLPKHGGKGMHGIRVHEAVIASGDKYAGATVHFVDDGIDTGKIICQDKIEVLNDDTAESLQKRVLDEVEHKLIVKGIKILTDN